MRKLHGAPAEGRGLRRCLLIARTDSARAAWVAGKLSVRPRQIAIRNPPAVEQNDPPIMGLSGGEGGVTTRGMVIGLMRSVDRVRRRPDRFSKSGIVRQPEELFSKQTRQRSRDMSDENDSSSSEKARKAYKASLRMFHAFYKKTKNPHPGRFDEQANIKLGRNILRE